MNRSNKRRNTYQSANLAKRYVLRCRFCSPYHRDRRAVHPERCLIHAVRWGDMRTTKALIRTFGLGYAKEWSNGYNLVRRALRFRHPEVAKELLMRGARVNSKIKNALQPPLILAVQSGYTEIVSMLLERNAEVNPSNDSLCTPLLCAVDTNNLEIVKLLIEGDARIDAISDENMTPLFEAFDAGKLEIAKEILRYGIRSKKASMTEFIDKDCTALHLAVFQQDEALVEVSLKEGADIDAKMSDGKTALHIATIFMDDKIVALLLKRGANVDADEIWGGTALHLAAKFGYTEVARILVDNKANVNAIDESYSTPLKWAADGNHLTVVKLLLDRGADVNAKQDCHGSSALHIASHDGNIDLVKLLLKRNARLNALDGNKYSPLHVAIAQDRSQIVHLLLSLGATIDPKNTQGQTALHIAAKNGSPSAAQVLLDRGADVNRVCDLMRSPLEYTILPFFMNKPDNFWLCHGMQYKKVMDILRQHIIAMMMLGLNVSEKNRTSIDFYNDVNNRNILDNCQTEVTTMRKKYIGDSNVTFFDILTRDINQLVSYTRNESIVEALQSINLNDEFPMYRRMIVQRIREGKQQEKLLNSSLKSLNRLFGYVLPDLFAIKLFHYLTNKDLKNLTKAAAPSKQRLR